ncbi:hypothetical protein AJ79_06258 [Helicocarpus griseus UAMH5409]|uniref:Uncharacterized protein n=1 Tax=Helicocarpus griseus UAMH5409 TaxID=1447875 RepID=A0A2B7XFJ2_9EURO|nr:hypothetical protein AJ79_06258 [Helicocarpus griseus UAMH5409]
MVLRASSSAASRLKRAKSTSSVKSSRHIPPVPELIDPQIAHYHALTAASIAMQRSNHRSSMDLRGSCDTSNHGDSEADGIGFRYSKPRSIRFNPNDNDGAHSQQPCTQSPSSIASPGSDGTVKNVPAFNAAAEQLTPRMNQVSGIRDSVSSAPSSYRKLRKAKSMFSTRKRAMKDASHSPHRAYNYSDSPETGHLSRATLRRSKSFFETETAQQPGRMKRVQSQDAAIQLAREQYLQGLKQPKQNDGSESVRNRRERYRSKPFRKSLRSSSGQESETDFLPTTQSTGTSVARPTEHHRSSKSRIFSISIKNGLRRIFGRNSTAQEDANMSVERQRKRRLEFSNYISSESTGKLGLPNSLHRYLPDTYAEPTTISNRPASIRTMISSDSFNTSSSRVTSWTDSTAANTVAARDPVSERSRLSIIQENGGPPEPIPSPSSFHYNDGYSVFRKPLYTERNSDNSYDAVDSQRVYSALVRHMGEAQHDDKRDMTPTAGTVRRPNYSPSLSVYSHRTSNTVRHIPSEASMRTIKALPGAQRKSPSSRSHVSVGSNYPGDASGLTPQEIAQQNENVGRHRSRQPLRQTRSFFKPSPQARLNMPNPLVPPRLSSYENVRASDDDTGSVIISRPNAIEEAIGESPISPSVYSRTTSGETPRRNESNRDLSLSESSDERGTVTILTSERLPYRPKDTGGYTRNDRQTKPSADWRSWMSSQMDLLETAANNYSMPQYDQLRNSHYREDTQINDDTYDQRVEESPTKADETQSSSTETPEKLSSCAGQRPPLMELKSFAQSNFSRPLRLSPDVPLRVSRTTARKPSVVIGSESPHSVHINTDANLDSASLTGSNLPRDASRSPSVSPLVYSKPRFSDYAKNPVTPTRAPKNLQSTVSIRHVNEQESPSGPSSDPIKTSKAVNVNSMRSRRDNGGVTNENARGIRAHSKNNLSALGDIHSTISSKRMVDLFLSQRRRQMGAAENATENAFL